MQKRLEKEASVARLREQFSRVTMVVLTDFTGMRAEEIRAVKGQLRQAKGEWAVVKNTMAVLASSGTMVEPLAPHFKGATAVVFSFSDPIGPAKALKGAADNYNALKIRSAVIEGQVVDVAGFLGVALLPPRGVVLGQLVGQVRAPLSSLVGCLNGIVAKCARTLSAVLEKRQAAT